MEGQSILCAIRFPISHLPTLLLVVGYSIYWFELYFFRAGQGRTTPLAWLIFGIFALLIFLMNCSGLAAGLRNLRLWFSQVTLSAKLLLIIMGIIGGIILFCALYASLLPPHLPQEFDALNYHITLPRQHLLRGTFSHIAWSTTDLFILPIDFALAPYWLATSLPNKIPQFFFVIGLLGICARIAWRLSGGKIWPSVLLVLAVLGSHNIGIQLGTAMLDIAICYLFVATLDSFLNKSFYLGATELALYFWSKPLLPLQFLASVAIFGLAWLMLRSCGVRKNIFAVPGEKSMDFLSGGRYVFVKASILFIVIGVFLSGPFMFKSLRYSATPMFPLGVGKLQSLSIIHSQQKWDELRSKSQEMLATKDQYGSGRGFSEFLRHFWLVAVPEKGVNNRYDYPLGLMYLLFLGPFSASIISAVRHKTLPLLSLWVIVSWGIWWFSAQQTRFLFIPLVLMYLVVLLPLKAPSRILLSVMLIALSLTCASVFRANKQDLGRWGESVLRQQDKELVLWGTKWRGESVLLDIFDGAFATFPYNVEGVKSVFVLKVKD